jgi:Na+/proline symporter
MKFSTVTMAWFGIAAYGLLTIVLTIRGALKTKSLSSYAVGNRDIPPALVGLSLSAQLTSVATFVVNPGLIYSYGIAGMLGLGLAAAAGIVIGLIVFSKRFRSSGSQVQALTIPQWIGVRYGAPGMRKLFGVLSLALVSFAVLIVVAIALVLSKLLQVDPRWLVLGVVVIVFTYVLVGGANTHAYTNAIQAVIMLIVALVLIGSGLTLFWEDGGLIKKLASISPNLASPTNPASLYFRNLFEVFVCNFLVGLAIVCQPHILSKALYLKEDSQVRTYLTVAIAAGLIFVAVMFVGLYARVNFHDGIQSVSWLHQMIDGKPLAVRMDHVVPLYIATHFSPMMQVLIGIGVLCAGLSTLEGILLALSTIISIDLYLPSQADPNDTEAQLAAKQKQALYVGRVGLILFGALVVGLCYWQLANPTGGSVAIFAQYGVYLLFTVSFFPLACGMFFPKVPGHAVQAAVVTALLTYLIVAFLKLSFMANNPAFLATCSIFTGWFMIGLDAVSRRNSSTHSA